jgi:hypothetical protein
MWGFVLSKFCDSGVVLQVCNGSMVALMCGPAATPLPVAVTACNALERCSWVGEKAGGGDFSSGFALELPAFC